MFVHFSGWNIDDPGDISRYSPRYRDVPLPQLQFWREWAAQYRAALLQNGYVAAQQWPYAFDSFDDGRAIDGPMRLRHYREFWSNSRPTISPFARGAEFYQAAASA